MHNSYRYRWMITVLACAGLIGLALAGGTWQTSSASVNPPTIPGISTMDPGWLRLGPPTRPSPSRGDHSSRDILAAPGQ